MTGTAIEPDQHLLVVEHAKGVLMLRYGLSSYEALSVLLSWSRESGATLADLAHALTHGVCQGQMSHAAGYAALVRWLETRLRGELAV